MLVIDWEPAAAGQTVGVLHAVDEIGNVFRVAVDHRPFYDIVEAVASGEDVEIEPESWQVLGKIGVQV